MLDAQTLPAASTLNFGSYTIHIPKVGCEADTHAGLKTHRSLRPVH